MLIEVDSGDADQEDDGKWTCDECAEEFAFIDDDGCNVDPERLGTRHPYHNRIGDYCEECFEVVVERLACKTCRRVGINPPPFEGECWECYEKTL